jgi:putative DNA primase/helicase
MRELNPTSLAAVINSSDRISPEKNIHSIQLDIKNKLNFNRSDTGNADRLVHFFGDKLKFNKTNDKWYIYNGKAWVIDLTDMIYDFVKETIKKMYGEASLIENSEDRKGLLKHISYTEKYQNQKNLLALAEKDANVRIKIDEFDSRLDLYNCLNGTIKFNDGDYSFYSHSKDDHLTQIVRVEYNSTAKSEKWSDFLNFIFNNDITLIEFIQRAIGYSLTGYTSEDCLFFMFGIGANGKSTFVEIIKMLLGDYFKKANNDLILQNKSEGVRNDIARLNGARFVVLSEIEDGRRLNESLVKDLTGGDTITTRYLYKEYFEFKPQFKLWLYGNHKPIIRGTDEGIKRRIRLIPFEVVIPNDQRQPREKILNDMKKELPGILNWALEGYTKWKANGLGIPDKVKIATAQYFDDMDIISGFIKERCNTSDEIEIKANDLYNAFKQYLNETGENINISQRKLNDSLREKGFSSIRRREGYFWQKLCVNEP